MIRYLTEETGRYLSEEEFLRGAELLPPALREYAAAPRPAADRARRLAGLLLLFRFYTKLCPATPMPPLLFSAQGKPSLPGDPFYFNISHAGRLAVCAVADRPLGADLVLYRETEKIRYEALAARFFSPEERAALGISPDPARCFAEIFARKEAVVKASGEGLSAFRRTNTAALSMTLETTLCDSVGDDYFLAVYCGD